MASVQKSEKGTPQPGSLMERPRLEWHDAIADRFSDLGVDKTTWKVLIDAVWPAARTANAVVMALSYCKARRLDPFKKAVHIVPVYDSAKRSYVETVWPSISELRTTAFRTGQYAGCDETQFGPDVTRTFVGKTKDDDGWKEITKTVTFPEWAQVTIYRIVAGQRVAFVGPKVYWLETYARMEPSEAPNRMWERRARGQIEKCAEAGALRKGFPEEIGNEYAAEEMEGQRFYGEMRDVTPKPTAAALPEIPDENEPAPAAQQTTAAAPAATYQKSAPAPAKAVDDLPPDDDGWPGPKVKEAVK